MNVLTICLGNRWRSPLAAYLLRHLRPEWGVRSGGLATREGVRMERPAREFLFARWPAISRLAEEHRSRHVTDEDLIWADEIIVMNPVHAQRVDEMCPEPRGLVQIASYAGAARILDPHMRPLAEQLAILEVLHTAVMEYARVHP